MTTLYMRICICQETRLHIWSTLYTHLKAKLVVSGGAALAAGTLLNKLGVALSVEGLPGDLLLHVGALLPGGRGALPDRDV